MTPATVHPVDEKLPIGKLTALGLQHVMVMYAGAIAVPLIVGRALKLSPDQVALLISADLFACGIVTLIQSLGFGRYFGIRLPVMMGVTFAAVGPMVAFANAMPGVEGARAIFGAIIGAGVLSMLIAPLISRLLRFFPPVVTGTIIAIIGISLMRVGVGWAVGGPAQLAQTVDVPKLVAMVDSAKAAASAAAAAAPAGAALPAMKLPGPIPMLDNLAYGALDNLAIAAFVLVVILLLVKFMRGFVANISVLLGMAAGCVLAISLGKMNFDKVGKAHWFDVVTPFAFGPPTFDIVMILTMTLVMVVVMIESVGMFLALSDLTGKKISQAEMAAGLRTDGLGTLIGGIFNTFPYTSFSQNVGLVGVTGVKSRWVCVAGGVIMIILGMLPKMAAFVESIPIFVLGGAGLVMFGMVAATGIRILSTVDYKGNRNNLYIVALAIGFGLIPLVAPRWMQQMAHSLHPLLESGILLTAVSAVLLNLFFNGAKADVGSSIEAAKLAEAH
ncbi:MULTISPECIES: nucleobase:cation symporter-2 family protein [unclassified Polaromonas]|uniref:nucleobase:cation symporter-2 family protein n=1 Tax=unclassified Polaromonas TaxID=2638319 RepID=UPI0018CB0AA0|nr:MULTISPECIES: nucleobase:cation symporter-2 family protein [unclassified Polaromonas]MBG6072217.1 NCS2 family nucleobase:cation symporter-2 [Polaromonas sp. CG_9.7]MBG6114352.1 NCS2 family nucleobase:cation symporter-2 [Polaromonas sp. CG_9.2]MDH6182689.1 NCS2 family nucleobase:cation symporter-2 [Polaromonas sp. CG_23.6]